MCLWEHTSALILSLFTQPPNTLLNMMAKVKIFHNYKYFLILKLPQSKIFCCSRYFGWFWLFFEDWFNISLGDQLEGLRQMVAEFCEKCHGYARKLGGWLSRTMWIEPWPWAAGKHAAYCQQLMTFFILQEGRLNMTNEMVLEISSQKM